EGVDLGAAVAVGVGVALGDPVAVGVGEGDPQGLTGQLKISIEAIMLRPASYPPAFQMLLVPSVSAAKLRPAIANGGPTDHVPLTGSKICTSLVGALKLPPRTYIWLQKFTALVLLVASGMSGSVLMESATGLYTNAWFVSVRVPGGGGWISTPPPV